MGITGVSGAMSGFVIVFFLGTLQLYFSPGLLPEPLYLSILAMMDFYIGITCLQVALNPKYYILLNRRTAYLRRGLSLRSFFLRGFFAEGKGPEGNVPVSYAL